MSHASEIVVNDFKNAIFLRDPNPTSRPATASSSPVTSPPALHSFSTMGGGGRYPYPKYVYSPAGGWWTRPSNWATNTAVAFAGILTATYFIWNISASHEKRVIQPNRPIPSMLWAKEYTEKKDKIPEDSTH
ncbi:hypothetical protein CPB84DRAFT_1966356 [Gymnopilus junonius]|uniref:Uncharacterized protein n=1 Tax=Gymnopilus junonius TaxID=109634 RepID=A0A9P5N9Z9_GYMJU|nr:hypothetical protein CPB84DRAFT_1966356 [Gymnopilus junonius]